MGIKHRADSGSRKFRVLSKLCLGGQVRSFEMPYVSYPGRCAPFEKTLVNSERMFCSEKETFTPKIRQSY